jgi:hypothetical protein
MAGTFGKYALGVLGEVISLAVHSAKKLCLGSVRGHLSRRSIRMIVSTLMWRTVPMSEDITVNAEKLKVREGTVPSSAERETRQGKRLANVEC